MTWAVRLTDKAVADIAQAQDWYERQRVGLGGQFVGEVDKVLESLAENPLIYRKVMDLLRAAHARRFPYSVYFRVEGRGSVVVACLHQHRSPRVAHARRKLPGPSPQ